MADAEAIRWPADVMPRVRIANLFPLAARGFAYQYRSTTHALHLHNYFGTVRIDGREIALKPGSMTLSPAGLDSSYDLPSAGTHWCIHFLPAPLAGKPGKSRRKPPAWALPTHIETASHTREAADRFAQVIRLHARSRLGADPLDRIAASIALMDLLIWMSSFDLTATSHRPPGTFDPVEIAAAYIDRHLHEPISVGDLAEHIGLSQNQLARRFRAGIGTTLPRYILQRRIDRAKFLLSDTNQPIKQICARVGMPDPHHFNKQFRLLVGTSPSRWREAQVVTKP